MKVIILAEDDDPTSELDRARASFRGEGFGEPQVFHNRRHSVQDGRMNIFQLLKLWRMCGDYDVPFREDDYVVHSKPSVFVDELGTVEGWVGGNLHNGHNNMRQTIYVGVLPDGSSHT